MQAARARRWPKLVADKGKTKTKDEAKRAEVTAKIQAIFDATEADVKKILDGHRPQGGERVHRPARRPRARRSRAMSTAKMSAYKKDRYGGWLGGLRWAKDKLLGMPDEGQRVLRGRPRAVPQQMDRVITRVADIVGNDLTAAKKRIADGPNRDRRRTSRACPRTCRRSGPRRRRRSATGSTQLESEVDAKQESVVDTLATKYVEARKGLDERIEALQAENKGLVDKAIGAIKAVINTIRELVAMLKNVLSRVAGVVGDIVKHPVAFLGNLIAGRQGRHPQVQGQHPRPPPQGPDELAVRRARRGRRRAARHVRPQGHHQAARLDLRADLDATSATGSSSRSARRRWPPSRRAWRSSR